MSIVFGVLIAIAVFRAILRLGNPQTPKNAQEGHAEYRRFYLEIFCKFAYTVSTEKRGPVCRRDPVRPIQRFVSSNEKEQ
jgi:hypothetical protein